MQEDVKSAILKASAMLDCHDLVKAVSAIETALHQMPDANTKIALWQVRDDIRSKRLVNASTTLCGLLATEEDRRTKNQSYAKPPAFAVLPVIYYTLRGVIKPKAEGGSFWTTIKPGQVQHVLFMRHGHPVGLALCRDIVHHPDTATWVVTYGDITWLET